MPKGPIVCPQAEGYSISSTGTLTAATAITSGKRTDGAIVAAAAEEATFLQALVDGKLHVRQQFLSFYGATAINAPGRPGNAFIGEGAGAVSRSYVSYDHTGTQIAVPLLNLFL